ncbi:MAG: lysophospholipid acyltransferase family protein [Candidatus Falkowbacteria bacterium]|nr:lysophospholipid acyltransferase family protein [Candidatus Falkowbacteria bacterium]
MKKIRNVFFFWLLLIPGIIIVGWLFLGALELFGVIRIHNKQLIPKRPKGLLLISNHPSFWEPFVLNYLFMKQMTLDPVKLFPYSAPDLKNFDKWYWSAFRDRFIFFPRGNQRGCAIAHARASRLLKRGRIVIMFPEGGRTSTNKCEEWFISRKGYRLRPLKPGAIRLALQTNCDVLPVWVKGAERVMPRGSRLPKFWRRIDITVGPVFKLKGGDNKEDLEKGKAEFVKNLHALADED